MDYFRQASNRARRNLNVIPQINIRRTFDGVDTSIFTRFKKKERPKNLAFALARIDCDALEILNTFLPIQILSTSLQNPGAGVRHQSTICPKCPNNWHFIFIHKKLRQHIQSGIAPPCHTWKGIRRLLQLYQRTFSKIKSDAQGTACQLERKARIEYEQKR
ncbi:MAG: hypothetical protein EZS28_051904, partial [Streblomastix strix]